MGESNALSPVLCQAFSDEESLPVGKCRTYLGAEARQREVVTLVHQQTIEPRGADRVHLAFDRKVGSDFHLDAAGAARIISSSALGQVFGHPPDAILQALNDTRAAQGFQPSRVSLYESLRIASPPILDPRFRKMLSLLLSISETLAHGCAPRPQGDERF